MSPDSATFWQAANSRCNSTDSPLINETTQSLSIRIVCDVRAFLVLLVARPAVVDILDTLLAFRRLWWRRPVIAQLATKLGIACVGHIVRSSARQPHPDRIQTDSGRNSRRPDGLHSATFRYCYPLCILDLFCRFGVCRFGVYSHRFSPPIYRPFSLTARHPF